MGSIISSAFRVGRASSLKPKYTGKLKKAKVNEHRSYIQGDFFKSTHIPDPPPTTNNWAVANILMRFMTKNFSDRGKLCSIMEFPKIYLVGRGGASSPKRWENHYSVIHHSGV